MGRVKGLSAMPAAPTRKCFSGTVVGGKLFKHDAMTQEEFANEFHRLLGRLVHAHARFDFNAGLQLRWLGQHNEVDVDPLLNAKVPFEKRLRALKPLVLRTYSPAGPAAMAEFQALFKRARGLKALRNSYVHGRWAAPARWVNGDPVLAFVPLHWDMDPQSPDRSIEMHLAEFADQVKDVETLFSDYWQLEERYRAFARPAAWYERQMAQIET